MNSPLAASKVYVAGHRGLAGSALVRALQAVGCTRIVSRTHAELDLLDRNAVRSFFDAERPEVVFLAAAKVGGILANRDYPAEFIYQNLVIETNVIEEAYRHGVQRLLFLGSSCIYPRECPQPIREEALLTGPLESTNRAYAVAKIAGIELCWSYNRQYGTQYVAAMPTNLYGPNDNYDLASSHVLPALLRKMHEAKQCGASQVQVWGTGKVLREFLHADDMASACLHLLSLPQDKIEAITRDPLHPPLFNVGCGEDLSIRELAELVAEVVGFTGELVFDASKPDGTPRKLMDVSRLRALGWTPRIGLREGLTRVYAGLKQNNWREFTARAH